MSKESTLARDLLTRAGHTAWQAGAATAGALWASSGMHVSDLAHASGWSELWTVVAVGAGSAALSAVKTSALGYLTGRRAKLLQIGAEAAAAGGPKLQADIAAGDVDALIKDVKSLAADAEGQAVDALQPTQVDGDHPAAADPDNAA